MFHTIIHNATIYTHDQVLHNGWIAIDNGIINHIDVGTPPPATHTIDAHGAALLPGFIDLHVHGGAGHSTMQATPQALHGMAHFFAQHGVTSFLAATITDSEINITRALETIASCMGPISGGAQLLGAYCEGPYISEHAQGAHPLAHIRRANSHEYMPWLEIGAIKQITIAPEFAENMELIAQCAHRGITPAVGHSVADYATVHHAAALGANQATHLFNAMGPLHHRNPGMVGTLLTHDGITAELIADLVHVHPAMLNLAVRAKGVDKIVLITDAECCTGLPHGLHQIGEQHFNVNSDAVYLPNGTLAGSVLTMNNALRNMSAATGLTLAQTWPMSSYNAARQLNMHHTKGLIARGYDADIVILDTKTYTPTLTMCQGKTVFQKNIWNKNDESTHSPHAPF